MRVSFVHCPLKTNSEWQHCNHQPTFASKEGFKEIDCTENSHILYRGENVAFVVRGDLRSLLPLARVQSHWARKWCVDSFFFNSARASVKYAHNTFKNHLGGIAFSFKWSLDNVFSGWILICFICSERLRDYVPQQKTREFKESVPDWQSQFQALPKTCTCCAAACRWLEAEIHATVTPTEAPKIFLTG